MKRFLSFLSLNTPESRMTVWAVLTVAIFLAPFDWLKQLSLYKRIGWSHAPSIGLTRAYWYLLHGHAQSAWRMNRLIFAILLIGIPVLVLDATKLIRRFSDAH